MRALKPTVFALSLLPAAWLFFAAATDALGPNPAEALIRGTGDWALRFLCITLAITPLRQATGWHTLARVRRMLGLFSWAYATLHALSYGWLDMGLLWADITRDIAKRPFITVGVFTFLGLCALAATSFNAAVRALGAIVAGRIEASRSDDPPVVLMVHGLQRFRSLRRDEDDFSFSSGEGPPKADRVLAAILRDGPGVGVHAIVWADTATSLQRCVDRGSMLEFDLRVLMQMGANDSSALIDSPAASRLGAERALLFSEERGTIERFRPFEPATGDELATLLKA